jgi:hypothetical protein
MIRSLWGYSWLTYRRDPLWFPAAFLALLVLLTWMMPAAQTRYGLARAYLGFLLPLVGGILAAYAVLDDPAIELRFATPVGAAQMLFARVGLILGVQTLCALLFQVGARALDVDLTPLGGTLAVQLAWLVPTLALVALGTAGALAGANCGTGAFLVGALWLGELLMKSWILANGRHLYIFMGVVEPHHPDLLRSQGVAIAAAAGLFALSVALLRRQERFL